MLVRFLIMAIVAVAVSVLPVAAEAAAPNPRYASFVIDVDRNVVLHASNADARRYPASLTKMMTLYLTFEALKNGKLSWDQKLPISAHAAGQPQTNIALKPGGRLAVRDAVPALIIRSANDAAVVLAEALGGSESNFASMMTRKAQALGMSNTQFKNANGLHNPNQYTTARDMARLGIALRRDFPKYYHLFGQEKFTYNGRTYYSHNRVTRFTDGVDGIKTGYVNASGFNLVSSMNKNGHHLVGVVLGGRTAQSRDSHMITLLSDAMRKTGPAPAVYALKNNPPVPQAKPDTTKVELALKKPAMPLSIEMDSTEDNDVAGNAIDDGGTTYAANEQEGTLSRRIMLASYGEGDTNIRTLTPLEEADRQSRVEPNWGIQVGAFSKAKDALLAAAAAIEMAPSLLASSKIRVADASTDSRESIHRARLANLTEIQARTACQVLKSRNEACFVYRSHEIAEF